MRNYFAMILSWYSNICSNVIESWKNRTSWVGLWTIKLYQ